MQGRARRCEARQGAVASEQHAAYSSRDRDSDRSDCSECEWAERGARRWLVESLALVDWQRSDWLAQNHC